MATDAACAIILDGFILKVSLSVSLCGWRHAEQLYAGLALGKLSIGRAFQRGGTCEWAMIMDCGQRGMHGRDALPACVGEWI
ncbi:hypothetical protein O166_08710 [Pseudogulbenkiania ferrooxidans EGD-HP2]|uniref:Uncharacterized protein n=1 Tax=Pseudogulbenkiania ferrooxidans EGD-HP2 TaxID=1388764 RepID=A0ABN0N6G4_9NEIS|nr:hypothetical protein O166_08710 [Pseudogulbenkiania ferrooxidans EGD-HP2]